MRLGFFISLQILAFSSACTLSPAPAKPTFSKMNGADPSSEEPGTEGEEPDSENLSEVPASEEEPETEVEPEPKDLQLVVAGTPTEPVELDSIPLELKWETPVEAYAYYVGSDCKQTTLQSYKQVSDANQPFVVDASMLAAGKHKVCILGKSEGLWEKPGQEHSVEFERKDFYREIPVRVNTPAVFCAPTQSTMMSLDGTLVFTKKTAVLRWKPKDITKFSKDCLKNKLEFESPLHAFVITDQGFSAIWRQTSLDTRWIQAQWKDETKKDIKDGATGKGSPGTNRIGAILSVVEPTTPTPMPMPMP